MATPEDPLEKMQAAAKQALHRYDVMASEMEEARAVGRDAIYRVVVLSAAIAAFSATLLSVENIDLTLRTSLLRVSWSLFAIVVFLGPAIVFIESRARYAITWRSVQTQDFERRKPTWKERLQLFGLGLYTVLVRPRNLIFVRDTDYGDPQKAWLNAQMIQRFHSVWDLALALELLFWLVFGAALTLLVTSAA